MVVTVSAARQVPNTFVMAVRNLLRPTAARKSFLMQITASGEFDFVYRFGLYIILGALAGTSDILCQKFVEKRDKIDFKRAAGFAGVVCFCVVSSFVYISS